jgi:hypothetical protein
MAMGGELVEMWTADDGETDVPARLRHSWSDVTSCAKVRFTDRLHLHSGSSSDIPATLESSMYRSHVGPESLQQRCECSEEEPPASPSSHRGAHSQSYLTTIASKSDSGLDEVSDRRGQAQSKLKIASSDEVVPPKLKMDRVSAADVKRCRTPLIQELLACCHGLNCIGDSVSARACFSVLRLPKCLFGVDRRQLVINYFSFSWFRFAAIIVMLGIGRDYY